MALQNTTNINIDFNNKKYILINAKRHDKKSRFLSVTCYSHGEIVPINAGEHSAYIRYKKPDNHSVFNFCDINSSGKIIVELTEQMLATEGLCYADLVIINKGTANMDSQTGEITTIDNASILSTMTLCIDVGETPVENTEIESTYEFNVLNETLQKYEAEYKDVILTSKSWAVGGTGTRNNEDLDNAKYYAELALKNAYGGDSIVTGVRGGAETNYRNGQVTITAYNVGAIPTSDVATVTEVKNYLGIE